MAGREGSKREAGDACVCAYVIPIFYLNPYFRSFQFEQLVIYSIRSSRRFLYEDGWRMSLLCTAILEATFEVA